MTGGETDRDGVFHLARAFKCLKPTAGNTSLTNPHHLILVKEFQLETKHSNIGAFGSHSHSNHQKCLYRITVVFDQIKNM